MTLIAFSVWTLGLCVDAHASHGNAPQDTAEPVAAIQKLRSSEDYQEYCEKNPSTVHPYYRFLGWWALERVKSPERDATGSLTKALLENAAGFGGWSYNSSSSG